MNYLIEPMEWESAEADCLGNCGTVSCQMNCSGYCEILNGSFSERAGSWNQCPGSRGGGRAELY